MKSDWEWGLVDIFNSKCPTAAIEMEIYQTYPLIGWLGHSLPLRNSLFLRVNVVCVFSGTFILRIN